MSLSNDDIFFELLIKWIDENLENDLSLDRVAAHAGFSKRYLQECFANFTGLSIGEYIRLRRLTSAYILLRVTNLTPFEIANLYRWETQQSFTRAFRKQFNIPPSALRKADASSHNNFFPIYEDINNAKYRWDIQKIQGYYRKEFTNEYEIKYSDFFKEDVHYEHLLALIEEFIGQRRINNDFIISAQIKPMQKIKRGTINFTISIGEKSAIDGKTKVKIIDDLYLNIYYTCSLVKLEAIIHYAHQNIVPMTGLRVTSKEILLDIKKFDRKSKFVKGILRIPVK